MGKFNLNTLNFIPSRGSEKDKPWSVIFRYSGVYRERRWDTEEEADKFLAQWPEGSAEKSHMPMYINTRTSEEHK